MIGTARERVRAAPERITPESRSARARSVFAQLQPQPQPQLLSLPQPQPKPLPPQPKSRMMRMMIHRLLLQLLQNMARSFLRIREIPQPPLSGTGGGLAFRAGRLLRRPQHRMPEPRLL